MHAHNPTTRQISPRRALALSLCGVLACALSCGPALATPPPFLSPWLKIPTPPPAPSPPATPPTWTIDPGPPLSPDAETPQTLWFNDGQRLLVSRGSYDSRSLWTLDTPTGTWAKLTDNYEDADVSPDALRVVVATQAQLQILSWSPTQRGAVERVIPWPDYIDRARRLVTWLDDHTLLRIQQHDTDNNEDANVSPDGGAYGWYSYRCEVVDLRADPPSVTPQPCPESGFSYIGDVASDASHRLLISSSAEGCIDLSAILYAPNKPQQPLAMPPLNFYPAGDFTLGFTHSKDILLLSPCDLDHPNPTTGCNPERDLAPWHLFLWSSAFAQPKRLYSDLPPYAIPDAAARHIAWSVPGGVCVATLDPPSPRQCWIF
jgi:hypothetical protein